MYHVFTRTWWVRNPKWPQGKEPGIGRKHTLARNVKTGSEAQAICRQYNGTHKPGFLSRKAEYLEQ